jgi:outer membrane lipoprotein SlyB
MHPLIAGAAIAVMVASLTGVAAMTGLLPNSHGENKTVAEVAKSEPVKAPAVKPAPVAKVAKPVSGEQLAANDQDRYPTQPRQDRRSDANYREADYAQNRVQAAEPARACTNCGRVESVSAVQSQADPSGVGVVGGAVVGGLLGNQIGGGSGKTLATIAGAVGGGFAGNEVEKRTRTATTYQVRVRMENGQVRNFPYNSEPNWNQGDRVRVVDGYLHAANGR